MTADQLDVYQSIMLRAGDKDEAFEAWAIGLERSNPSPDTRVLLLMGQARAMIALGENFVEYVDETHQKALDIIHLTKSATRVRVHRANAELLINNGYKPEARLAPQKAEQIARENDMED